MSVIDDIKSRLDLVELISETVKLRNQRRCGSLARGGLLDILAGEVDRQRQNTKQLDHSAHWSREYMSATYPRHPYLLPLSDRTMSDNIAFTESHVTRQDWPAGKSIDARNQLMVFGPFSIGVHTGGRGNDDCSPDFCTL